ncbi:MAG: glutamate racemase [Alphaproteobacteria bacterium]|nr:glutamate racemase [Alphaproteobacteria bacterium]
MTDTLHPAPPPPHVLVVDSGLGGLSVADALRARAPTYTLSYLADYALFPYGIRSEAEILAHLPALVERAAARHSPDMVVIACNTASTVALPDIRARISRPVVGTVPAIKPAGLLSRSRTIGLLGTPGTVRRAYTQALIDEFAADCTVVRRGSSALVAAAEAKLARGADVRAEVRAELEALLAEPGGEAVDVIVLACTHFPFLREELEAATPRDIAFLDSGPAIARRVTDLAAGLVPPPAGGARPSCLLSADPPAGAVLAPLFAAFGFPAPEVMPAWPKS